MSHRHPLTRVLRVFLLALMPHAARAQLAPVEGLLKSFSDVGVYYTRGRLANNTPEVASDKNGVSGFGFELLFTAGARAQDCPTDTPTTKHRHRDVDPCKPASPSSAKSAAGLPAVAPAHGWLGSAALERCVDASGLPRATRGSTDGTKDTTLAPTGITIVVKGQPVSGVSTEGQLTCTMSVAVTTPPRKADTTVTIEIGLGYGQFSGFRSKDPHVDLRGAVREFPALSVYGNWEYPIANWFYPYLGLRTGLVVLQSARAYVSDPDSAAPARPLTAKDMTALYTLAGSAFQLGAVAGVSFRVSNKTHTYFFVEGYYDTRTFQSVEWSGGTAGLIPTVAPRRLDLSVWGATVGLQVPLGLKETK